MLAHVLGAPVRRSPEKEIGWCDVHLTDEGRRDPLLGHFKTSEKIFQLHGDMFDIPETATHLAWSSVCPGQAYRYGDKVYGLQFHLEVDQAMIARWLKSPHNRRDIEESGGKFTAESILHATQENIQRSLEISHRTFQSFIDKFELPERPELLGSGHGKPRKAGD
jgi:GMP synthase (glutamine-hydrolysing)